MSKADNIKELPCKAYYRPDEVADFFSIPIKTLYNWIAQGRVTAIRPAGSALLRISRETVELMKLEANE